jgi:type IV secretory pathway TraG/TraD family ATPase VirD4
VVGVPGAGKTTFLVAQLVDWMQSGRSFVATDIKPEIWSILKENGLFEKFGYDEYIINPTCAHAHRFNLFAEIEDDADLNEVLAVIIPPGEGDGAVFADNARRLLKAVLAHLGERASLPAARDFIMEAGKVSELLEMLAASDKKSVQRIAFELKNPASNERLLASIMTAMGRAFEFMDDDRINAAIGVSDFSMRDVLMKPKQAVFLQFEQKYKASLATLFGGTVAYVLRLLQANASTREHAVFVALDEIINAAPIPKFAESLNTMRSARMPLAMYLQSIEGLNRLYGPQSSEIFLGSADLKVIFRLNDNATAEYVSAQLGDTEQRSYNLSQSQSEGASDRGRSVNDAVSKGYTSTTARIFDAAEVLGLEPQKAVTIYRGSGARFTMPSYWQDFPMPARAAVDARPQAGFVQKAEAEAATA